MYVAFFFYLFSNVVLHFVPDYNLFYFFNLFLIYICFFSHHNNSTCVLACSTEKIQSCPYLQTKGDSMHLNLLLSCSVPFFLIYFLNTSSLTKFMTKFILLFSITIIQRACVLVQWRRSNLVHICKPRVIQCILC